MYDVIVVGGGAAGFYSAIHMAEARPSLNIAILEKGDKVLSKVKVSGGGRCNLTHAIFSPELFVKNYPRGEKELIGPFNVHGSRETVAFFEKRGISLKTEADGRIFPTSDTSQTIIEWFLQTAQRLNISIFKNTSVVDVHQDSKSGKWQVITPKKTFSSKFLLLATGSNPKVWKMLRTLGHTIEMPVPSLFTFHVNDDRINGMQGISVPAHVSVLPKKINGKEIKLASIRTRRLSTQLVAEGPLLITHWGLSGPAVLKLSAWGARILSEYNYRFRIGVNWLPEYCQGGVYRLLNEVKEVERKKTVARTKAVDLPQRLWRNLVSASGIEANLKWAEASKMQLETLSKQLTASEFIVEGKSAFKEEFVTAGGVVLKEIDFKTFESKICPNLFLAGEILNIDAITGGFNFQNAWTGAYIAAKAIASR